MIHRPASDSSRLLFTHPAALWWGLEICIVYKLPGDSPTRSNLEGMWATWSQLKLKTLRTGESWAERGLSGRAAGRGPEGQVRRVWPSAEGIRGDDLLKWSSSPTILPPSLSIPTVPASLPFLGYTSFWEPLHPKWPPANIHKAPALFFFRSLFKDHFIHNIFFKSPNNTMSHYPLTCSSFLLPLKPKHG